MFGWKNLWTTNTLVQFLYTFTLYKIALWMCNGTDLSSLTVWSDQTFSLRATNLQLQWYMRCNNYWDKGIMRKPEAKTTEYTCICMYVNRSWIKTDQIIDFKNSENFDYVWVFTIVLFKFNLHAYLIKLW